MKKHLFILFLFCPPVVVFSQRINSITVDQLKQRVDAGKDTTYIINFWATWCSPCIKELPAFEKFGQDSKTEKMKLLLISVDLPSELKTSVIPFIKKNNFRSEVLFLTEKDPQEYINRIDSSWSGAIPSTLFVKKGKRLFFEQDFTYDELVKEYNLFKTGL